MAAIGLLLFGFATLAPAQSGVWTNLLGGSWTNAINWTNNIIATNTDNTADFSQLTLGSAPTVTLDGARTIGNLILGDQGNTYGWTLNTGGGGPLTLAVSGGTPTVMVNGQTNTIGLVLAGTGFAKAGAGALNLTNSVSSETGTISVNAGTLILDYSYGFGSTLSTPFLVSTGATLIPTSTYAFGYNEPITVLGGTLKVSGGTATDANTYENNLTLANGATVTGNPLRMGYFNNPLISVTGTVASAYSSGITLVNEGYSVTFNIAPVTGGAGPDLTISGPIVDLSGYTGMAVYKTNTGTLTLSGTNTYSGVTTVSSGTLALVNNASLSSSTIQVAPAGLLNVSGLTGTFTLGTSQTLEAGNAGTAVTNVSGNLTNGGTLNIAGIGTNGTLTIDGNLALAGGTLDYDLFAPNSADLIALAGASHTLSLSGTSAVTPAEPVTNGTYTLINGIGSVSAGGAANLTLAVIGTNAVRGTPNASFAVNAPSVTLAISGESPTNLFWQGVASGAWDVNTTANWTNSPGGTRDYFFNLDTVNFTDTTTNAASGTNVTLSAKVYPAAVVFNNSSHIFSLAGSGSIAGAASLTQSGTSTTIISNANSYTGGTTITAGTLELATNNPNGLGLGSLTMTGGTLNLNSNNLSILTLGGTGGVITDSYTNGGAAGSRTLTVYQVASNTFAGTINNGPSNRVALVQNGPGYLKLTGSSTFTNGATVNAGTLEVDAKGGSDTAYTVAQGATLKYGYSTLTTSYSPFITVNGSGVGSPYGLYLLGGKSININGTLTLQNEPTTIQTYGTGNATLYGFDVNYTFLTVTSAASGSIISPQVNLACDGYGFRMNVSSGANNASGDLLIGGVISGTAGNANGGPYKTNVRKDGAGSVLITNACTYSQGIYIAGGSVMLAGGANRLPANSGVILTGGSLLELDGVSQTLTNLSINSGSGNAVVGNATAVSTLVINNAAADTYTGNLGGTGANQNNLAFTKLGVGALNFTGQLTYTNNTTISAGAVSLGSLTNWDGATLSVADTAGTLAATNLALGSAAGSAVAITSFSGATSAPITVTNLSVKGVTTISLSGTFSTGEYPLIKFLSGNIGGGGSLTLQQAGLPRGVSAGLVTNVSNSSIDVLLTANPLIWVGATNGVSVSTWDDGVTTNWSLIGSPNYFTNNDNVQIDDTAIGSTTLNLAATVSPQAVLVTNNALNYTITATGASALTGGMTLTKQGTGSLTIVESNSFTGGVTISGGAINIQNGYAFNTNTVTVDSGTELQLQGGINVAPMTSLTLNSTGTNNTGGLHNVSGNNTYGGPITVSAAPARINSDSGNLTLTNGVVAGGNSLALGGSGNVTVSTATISGSAGLVKDGSGTNIWNIDPGITSGGITVNAGTFQINVGNFGGTFTPLLTIDSEATLWGTNTHATGGGTALVISNGTWLMSAEDYKENLTMMDGLIAPGPNPISSGADLRVGFDGGSGSWTWYVSNSVAGSVVDAKVNTIAASVTNVWDVTRGAAASDLTINGVIYDPGNVVFTGNGITRLTATNTYTGFTLLNGGTLVLASTAVVPTNKVTVAANGILTGNGTVFGLTTVQPGGTLQPGLGGQDTSALILSNSLSLAGNAQFVLDRTNEQNSSRVTGLGTVIMGGTLTVSNAGPALQLGDTFTLFQAAAYSGSFTNLSLPALTPPLVWNTNSLAVNGSITVQAPTSLLLSSSENPSGYKDGVAFTGNLGTPTATGTIVFQTNGVTFDTESVNSGSATSVVLATLPRGTNLITAIYGGNADYAGSSASLNQVVTNHPPVANPLTVTRYAGVASLKIALTDLATNWSDVDGDTISFVSASASTNGVNVTTNSGYVIYNNPNNVNDQFSYVVADSYGGTNTSVVNILINNTGVFGQTSPSITTTGGATTLSFAGIPGYGYSVQVSTNLTDWSTVWTTNAPADGVFQFTDGSPPQPTAFYRLQWNP